MPIDHRDWERLNAYLAGDIDPAMFSPERLEQVRQALVGHLRKCTLLRRYIAHLGQPDNRNVEPWHAEGERLYAALTLACVDLDGTVTIGFNADRLDPQESLRHAVSLAATILMAQSYLWTDEIEALVDQTPLPAHVISHEALPYPFMFWSRQTAHGNAALETNWTLLARTATGIRMVTDLMDLQTRHLHVAMGDIPHGAIWPDDLPTASHEPIKGLLARVAFLNSPYVETVRARLPRSLRRLGVREGILLPTRPTEGEIAVVTLRRDARASVEAHASDAARVYHHQWWVSGHIRSQWYPSEQAHHLKWIAPYLKGDPDAPIKPRVYAVTR